MLDGWDRVEAVIRMRRTQTNEPARCATLLPALALLPQPLALIEVGASAGLCLLPDHYGYDYGRRTIAPGDPDGPVFRCDADAATPLPQKNVEVAWRRGLDLNPLDPADESNARWLKALVWPGEGMRERQLDQALAVARRHPPRIEQGDLRNGVAALAAEAPKGATLVIFHTAVLNYVRDPAERAAFAAAVRATGAAWISNEDPDTFSPGNRRGWPGGALFLLSLNGLALARTESHGTSIRWLP